jgi:hypothetical protein
MVQECQEMAKEIEKEVLGEKVVDLKEFRKDIKETLKEFELENLRK